jgi:hypothetical protein
MRAPARKIDATLALLLLLLCLPVIPMPRRAGGREQWVDAVENRGSDGGEREKVA